MMKTSRNYAAAHLGEKPYGAVLDSNNDIPYTEPCMRKPYLSCCKDLPDPGS
jgi:hypothetical protein